MGLFDAFNYDPLGYMTGSPEGAPSGLLDQLLNTKRGNSQLMAFGQALAQAGAPRRGPSAGFAGGLSEALGAFGQAGQKFDLEQMQKQMQDLQLKKIQEDVRKASTINGLIQGALGGQQTTLPQGAPSGQAGTIPPMPNAGTPQPNQGMSMYEALALAKDDPKAAFDISMKVREGVKQDAGAYYTNPITRERTYLPDPSKGFNIGKDGTVSALPGFVGANADIKGAEALATESARAGLDLVDVPQSDGTVRKMTRAQAARQLGGQPQQPPAGIPPAVLAAAQSGKPYVASQTPDGKLSFGQPPTLGVTPNPLSQKAGEDLNKDFVSRVIPSVQAKGDSAGEMLNTVKTSRMALDKLGTGWGTEAKAMAANVLAGLGVAPKNVAIYASNAQIFQKEAATRLWQTLNDAKGPQTEGDAKRAELTFAKLSNTPRANNFILDMAEANAMRDKMKADFFRQAIPIAQKNGDLQEVEREWAKRQPSIWTLGNMPQWDK